MEVSIIMTTGLRRSQYGSVNMTREIPKWKCQYDYRASGDTKMEVSI